LDRPVLVGAQDSDAQPPVALQGLAMRVLEGIPPAAGDHRDFRLNRPKKIRDEDVLDP